MNPTNVEPSTEIRPAINAAATAAQALQPRAGTGSFLSKTPLGFAISGRRTTARFPHPWKPSLMMGNPPSIVLTRGLVDGLTPTIRVGGGQVPMHGDEKHPRPALKLLASDIDAAAQESWVCLEVYPNGDGRLSEEESVIEIVHRPEPLSNDPDVGRCPLVHLLWRGSRPVRAIAIVMFNLRYYRSLPADGEGVPQHFFI